MPLVLHLQMYFTIIILPQDLKKATKLLNEEKVAIVPGSAFGACGEGYLRVSYAYSIEELKEALGRLERFINHLPKKQ